MNEIDKTFSDLLKSNVDFENVDLKIEEGIMKQVHERSLVEEKLKNLRSRSLFVLKVAAALLIVLLMSVFQFGGHGIGGGLNVFYWMISLLGIGLFYFALAMRMSLGKGRTME